MTITETKNLSQTTQNNGPLTTDSGPTPKESIMTTPSAQLKWFFITAALFLGGTVSAASIAVNSSTIIAGRGTDASFTAPFEVSVNNSNAFINKSTQYGGGTLVGLTGTIADYDFLISNEDGPASYISEVTFNTSGSRGTFNLWTSGDPGVDAPISTALINGQVDGGAGTIDISTLVSGTVWFVNSGWNTADTLTATLSDSSATHADIDMTPFTYTFTQQEDVFAVDMSFDGAGEYDELSWSWSSARRFGGVILADITEVPEPSTMILAGLGLAGLTLRRRRQ